MKLSELWQDIKPTESYQAKSAGRLVRMVGLTLEAIGLNVRVGERCLVEQTGKSSATGIEAEVVGFDGKRIFLMPIEQADGVKKIRLPSKPTTSASIPVA